jgi:hypothetical protein
MVVSETLQNKYMHPTRIFKVPNELKQAFEEYKNDLKNQSNEWLKISYVGKDGDRVAEPQKVPMTFEGFKRFARNNYGDIHHYFDNTENRYDNFGAICYNIKEEIRENQIIGGLLNFYNPSITQRLNNLVEKQEVTIPNNRIVIE